jgi:hypothetical protein
MRLSGTIAPPGMGGLTEAFHRHRHEPYIERRTRETPPDAHLTEWDQTQNGDSPAGRTCAGLVLQKGYMGVSGRRSVAHSRQKLVVLSVGLVLAIFRSGAIWQAESQTNPNVDQSPADCAPSTLGSPYILIDSWIYPAVMRLYSLGYIDDVFLGLRPWTRASVGRMIEEAGGRIQDADESSSNNEAKGIYDALDRELSRDI